MSEYNDVLVTMLVIAVVFYSTAVITKDPLSHTLEARVLSFIFLVCSIGVVWILSLE